MGSLMRIYEAVLQNEVSTAFALAISAVLALSVLSRIPVFNRSLGAFDRSGAGIMTTLGVLGTFTGIFIGLLNFNVAQIDDSVPQLLDGLKIAFATSIVGMSGAISFKIIQGITPQPSIDQLEATPEDILTALKSIEESVEQSSEAHQSALLDLRRSISSDNESSLLTQVQKLRTSMQDGQQELIKEFRSFAETMSDNNSKALISALEQVIRDFNTQLNEQFGENFKQLNLAVGALLKWQENYKQHVETMEARIEAAVHALEDTKSSLEEVSAHTKSIPEMLAPLEGLLTGLIESNRELEAHLDAVAELKTKAIEAFPIIETNLTRLTTELEETITSSIQSMSSAANDQREALDTLREGYSELKLNASEAQTQFNSALESALEEMQKTTRKGMEGHAAAIDSMSDELRRQVNDAWSKTNENINQQFEIFDEQMKKELTRALELMGQHLAALSEKFVQDYEPLTNALREVVQIAKRAS